MFSSVSITEDGWHSSPPPHVAGADVWPPSPPPPHQHICGRQRQQQQPQKKNNPEVLRQPEIKLSMSVTFSQRALCAMEGDSGGGRGEGRGGGLISVFLCNENSLLSLCLFGFLHLAAGPGSACQPQPKKHSGPGRSAWLPESPAWAAAEALFSRCSLKPDSFPFLDFACVSGSSVISRVICAPFSRTWAGVRTKTSHAKSGKFILKSSFMMNSTKEKA